MGFKSFSWLIDCLIFVFAVARTVRFGKICCGIQQIDEGLMLDWKNLLYLEGSPFSNG